MSWMDIEELKSADNTDGDSIELNDSFPTQNDLIKVKSKLNHQLDVNLLDALFKGFDKLKKNGVVRKPIVIVADFTKSANEKRFFIVDMRDTSMVHRSLVAHGKNTGELHANNFSNKVGSYQSSLGFFLTAETYQGRHGLSLRLDGLEAGINDKARERAIVIHNADYVSAEFIAEHGRLGRSLGCPALPMENYEAVIRSIKEGCLLFAYGGEENYLRQSELLAGS